MIDILESINEFFELYFKKYLGLIKSNNLAIEKLKTISYPKMDFIFIFKFVRIELDHLRNIDASILDKELRSIFETGKETVSSLVRFRKDNISAHVIFKNNFTDFNDEARNLNARFEKARINKAMYSIRSEKLTKDLKDLKENDKENIQKQKEINKDLADTLQNMQDSRIDLETITIEKREFEKKNLPLFLNTYKAYSDKIVYELIQQIAIFSFTADRELWINAARSKKIINFFTGIKAVDKMNIEQYMEHHLNHQTSSNNKGEEAIQFRKKLIDSINKIKIFNARVAKNKLQDKPNKD
jgi:hypothetical protein